MPKIRNKEIAKIDRLFKNTLFGKFVKTKTFTSQLACNKTDFKSERVKDWSKFLYAFQDIVNSIKKFKSLKKFKSIVISHNEIVHK